MSESFDVPGPADDHDGSEARHGAPAADTPIATSQADAIVEGIRLAIYGVGVGDPDTWQLGVRQAVEANPVSADAVARAELAQRAERHGIESGMVPEIAHATTILSLAADEGPFECPAYLLELALRRALGEPGCQDFVDETELIYAATQCAGLIDLHDALLPAGWGWKIQMPLANEPG